MAAQFKIVMISGWILWVLSDGIWPAAPINGFATAQECRTAMRAWQPKLDQQRIETGVIERLACFPSEFDPRITRGE